MSSLTSKKAAVLSIAEVVKQTLGPSNIESDTLDYIIGLIEEDDSSDDTKEAIEALISATEAFDDDEAAASNICKKLFQTLDDRKKNVAADVEEEMPAITKLLEKSVKMIDDDEIAKNDGKVQLTVEEENAGRGMQSGIIAFFANQIGIRTEAAISEKNRRKDAQKKIREEEQYKMQMREIENEMQLAAKGGEEDDAFDASGSSSLSDNATDVHLRNFSLPNKKGQGADLLSAANLTLARGRRYGLLGRNGCGKTTLMELIGARQLKGVPKKMSLLLVKQEVMGSSATAVTTVLQSDTKRQGLRAFIKQCETESSDGDDSSALALSKAYENLALLEEEQGAPEPRVKKVLAGLGFNEEMMEKPTKELSGGWRMRVSLACALFADPALLLLDEPTNHLDLEAVLWLERYLTTKFLGTVLVVSHDRHFLNEVVTDVIYFHKEKLHTYKGDISNYEAVREEEKKNQIRLRDIQEAKREHMQKYIDDHEKSGANGPKAAAQRKSKMKKMERLGVGGAASQGKKFKLSYDAPAEETEEYREEDTVTLDFPHPGTFDGNMVTLDRASFNYPGYPELLSDIDMQIDQKSRMALLGRNGSGKSTLIKLIVGALLPTKGKGLVNGRAKIEYLAQHQLEQLDPLSTPLHTMQERYPGDSSLAHEQKLRNHLAKFGLGGETLPDQVVHTMSGGQKCRLCLAGAMFNKPHLLILDEPTNHLDLETTEALIEAIKTFGGGVLLVSHDQHLLTSVCKELYVVGGGKVEKLPAGTLDSDAFLSYKRQVIAGKR